MDKELFHVASISKIYGATKALDNIDLAVYKGEILCLIGANGAGKSTLMRVLSGVTSPDKGDFNYEGIPINWKGYNPAQAQKKGIHVVYQELSLCTNLSVYENFYLEQHSVYRGFGNWRSQLIMNSDNAVKSIFPGSNISVKERIGNLTLSNRQMIEISRASSMAGLKLLILDEPTSSLSSSETQQLMDHIKKLKEKSVAIIFISHRLGEVLSLADRVVVMKNGTRVWEQENKELSEETLVSVMAGDGRLRERAENGTFIADTQNYSIYVSFDGYKSDNLPDVSCSMHGGELIGVAGLDGNGQRDFLKTIFFTKNTRSFSRKGQICYVAGDRKKEGIFQLANVEDNMDIVEISKNPSFKVLDLKVLSGLVENWFIKFRIKAENPEALITSLSGGNQQKVIVARAFLADSDIIILDDPTKGVDIETKQQMYELFHEAANKGKLVIWYSTEDDELEWCSRVLVFRYGNIIKEITGTIQKSEIVTASFGGEGFLNRKTKDRSNGLKTRSTLLMPVIALFVVYGISALYQPRVLSWFGIDLLLGGAIPLIFAALAQMFIIGLSQIDLGVGAFMGLINVLGATILYTHFLLGILVIIATVLIYSLVGVLIYKRNIPAIIVTLGMSFFWLGVAYVIQDKPGGTAPEWLVKLYSLELPVPRSIILLVAGGLIGMLFYRSRYGTVLRGFGNNVIALERSGWSPLKAFATGYGISSLFAIFGGLVITASTRASDVNSITSYTMITIASVVIGGSELVGGIVSPVGTIVGALTLSLIGALLGFMRLDSSYVTAVQGLILILILASRLLRKVKL